MAKKESELAEKLRQKGYEYVPPAETLEGLCSISGAILRESSFQQAVATELDRLWREQDPESEQQLTQHRRQG